MGAEYDWVSAPIITRPLQPIAIALVAIIPIVAVACDRTRDAGQTATVEDVERPSFLVIDDWALSDQTASRADAKPWNNLLTISPAEAPPTEIFRPSPYQTHHPPKGPRSGAP